jgi:hypothetical protein
MTTPQENTPMSRDRPMLMVREPASRPQAGAARSVMALDAPAADAQAEPMTAREAQADTAAKLADETGITFMDGVIAVDLAARLEVAKRETGASEHEWLDTSRPMPAQPYGPGVDEAFARDQRRAQAAGVSIDRAHWEAWAEDGEDLVHHLASELRADRVERAQADYDRHLDAAATNARRRREQEAETNRQREILEAHRSPTAWD